MALRPSFPFRQAQYVRVFPLKSAPFCKLSAAPTSLPHFFLANFCFLNTLPSIFPITTKFSGPFGRNCLLSLSVLPGFKAPWHIRFLRATTRMMCWSGGAQYYSFLQSFSVLCILLFSWTGGELSHLNSLTHRFPRFPLGNLCFLVMFGNVLFCSSCKRYSLLLNYLSLKNWQNQKSFTQLL